MLALTSPSTGSRDTLERDVTAQKSVATKIIKTQKSLPNLREFTLQKKRKMKKNESTGRFQACKSKQEKNNVVGFAIIEVWMNGCGDYNKSQLKF